MKLNRKEQKFLNSAIKTIEKRSQKSSHGIFTIIINLLTK